MFGEGGETTGFGFHAFTFRDVKFCFKAEVFKLFKVHPLDNANKKTSVLTDM